jgi:endoglucanase
MNARDFCRLAGRLMRHPAAPYFEHAVRAEVEAICSQAGLGYKRDAFGNVLVRWDGTGKGRELILGAHLDHPGFEVIDENCIRFLGGVPDRYFRRGTKLRLMPGSVAGRLGRRVGKKRVFKVAMRRKPTERLLFAVWELPDFELKGDRIYGRACDDLIGVASVLATLIELKRRRSRTRVTGVITRAEEIGFHGALAVAGAREVRRDALLVSLETSRELPGVKMGEGVILRVGDRTSIFNSEAMRFLATVAAEEGRKGMSWQRALMSGGTCEATAYQEFGFQTAGVCVALGNYHNCTAGNRIAAEYVDVGDVLNMVNLLVRAAEAMPRFGQLTKQLPNKLKQLRRGAVARLRRTANRPRVVHSSDEWRQ